MSQFKKPYKSRPIRFMELYVINEWIIKIYSISSKNELVPNDDLKHAKAKLLKWLSKHKEVPFDSYKCATLLLHEFEGGVYAVINWWIDENMLQHFVYLKAHNDHEFKLYSDNGIVTCVWELAVLWHERNAWVSHILKKNQNPDWEGYYKDVLNENV